jgi:hypothetical protein
MSQVRWARGLVSLVLLAGLGFGHAGRAVEVNDLRGFEDLFGRYAPGGNCKTEPRIIVEQNGFTFEWGGKQDKVTKPEFGAAYGPPDYAGITRWFFPYRIKDGYSILMTFNPAEKKGTLTIEPQDEGYAGGPPLSPLNAALVKGSPYARCR